MATDGIDIVNLRSLPEKEGLAWGWDWVRPRQFVDPWFQACPRELQ